MVESSQSILRLGLADRREMEILGRDLNGRVSEVGLDLSHGDTFLKQMRRIGMSQRMTGNARLLDPGSEDRRLERLLHARLTHRVLSEPQCGEPTAILFLPASADAREQEAGVFVPPPPLTETFEHLGGDRHFTVLAAFAVDDAQETTSTIEVRHFQSANFPETQAAVIKQREHRDEAWFFDGGEQQTDFLAGEHGRDGLVAFDADLLPAGPVGALEVIAKEEAQGADTLVERAAFVIVVFLQMMKKPEDFLLSEEGWTRYAAMFGETIEPTEVALFRAFTKRFELDETDECV